MENLKNIDSVFIYLRKSRDNGDGVESLDNHKRTLLDICRRNGWNEVQIFEEIGTSQSIEARPAFTEMLGLIEDGEADLVLVMDIDRLSRGSLGDWDRIKKIFKEAATFVMTAAGTVYDYNNIDSTFTSDLLSVLSSYEYAQIKKRFIRGKKASHAKGNWVCGTPPLGYVYNPRTKKLDIDEEAAKIYELIKSMALQGKTNGQISKELNALGLKTAKGSKFVPTAVYRILSNPTYKGEIVLRRATGSHKNNTYKPLPPHLWEVTKNCHEPLISVEDFDHIQKLMEARNITPVSARRGVHILSGLLYCGYCGTLHSVTIPQKGKTSSYVKPCRKCKKKGFQSEIIEKAIAIQTEDLLTRLTEEGPINFGRIKDLTTKVEAGTEKIKNSVAGLERLTDLYIEGLITKDKYRLKQIELIEAQKAAEHEVKEAQKALKEYKGEDLPAYRERVITFLKAIQNGDLPNEQINRYAKNIIRRVNVKWEGEKLDKLYVSVDYQ